tara:strand:- start:98 stop:226 length:129 start_codon:yes stop_codon:yes gene_type:complete
MKIFFFDGFFKFKNRKPKLNPRGSNNNGKSLLRKYVLKKDNH